MSANQYLRRAVELAREGDLKSALAEVKRALKVEPGHEKGLVFRFTLEARMARREKRFGDAAVRYGAVLALDPDNREARQMLREHQSGEKSAGLTADSRASRTPAVAVSAAPHVTRAEQASSAGEHASDRPTIAPPPAPAARLSKLSEDNSARGAASRSSAPPMMEVVSLGGRRRPGAAARTEQGAPSGASPDMSRPTNAAVPLPVESVLASRAVPSTPMVAPPPDPVQAAKDPPIVVAAPKPAPRKADEMEDVETMNYDLPPPSVETPLEPERRIARRVAIEVDVGVSSESNFFTGFSGDISEGGLFIATYNLVPIGSHVHVSFGVMGREISCDAVVCWLRDPIDMNLMPGFGVRFGELSDLDHEAIAKFIHARAPMFYDDE